MRGAAVACVALAASLVTGCETTCIPTAVQAEDATELDLVAGSAVLRADLRADDTVLPGRQLTFDVLADGRAVHSDTASTGAGGTARLDLDRVEDVGTLAALVRADLLRASFRGDGTYCASADDAALRVVRAPAGLPVPTP